MNTDALTLASQALKGAVERALDGIPASVVLADPGQGTGNRVSVWLYQVGIDEFGRNAPPAAMDDRADNRRRAALPPLGLNLHYLVTPIFDRPEADQLALARILLGLYQNPVLAVTETETGTNEQVRIGPAHDGLDERARLWEALGKPYRLSACFLARTVRLSPTKSIAVAPVAVAATALPNVLPARG